MLPVTDLPHNQGRQLDIAEPQPSSEIHSLLFFPLVVATKDQIYLLPFASENASEKRLTEVPATLYSS